MSDYSELLRAAIRESSGDSPSARLARSSLMALIADDPVGQRILEEETGPEQVQMELHLEKGSIQHHAGPADPVGRFISNLAKGAAAVARQRSGNKRHKNRILLEGVAPGSLSITLRAPDTDNLPRTEAEPIDGTSASNIESEALRSLAAVFHAAEDSVTDPEVSNLSGLIATLPAPARAALKTATTIANNQQWTVTGVISQRSYPNERFALDPQAMGQLVTSLKTKESEPERREATGYIDGFKYTRSQLFFQEAGAKASYSVAVGNELLMLKVASLATDPERKVRVGIDFFTSGDEEGNVVQGRVLAWIQPVAEETIAQETLNLA